MRQIWTDNAYKHDQTEGGHFLCKAKNFLLRNSQSRQESNNRTIDTNCESMILVVDQNRLCMTTFWYILQLSNSCKCEWSFSGKPLVEVRLSNILESLSVEQLKIGKLEILRSSLVSYSHWICAFKQEMHWGGYIHKNVFSRSALSIRCLHSLIIRSLHGRRFGAPRLLPKRLFSSGQSHWGRFWL